MEVGVQLPEVERHYSWSEIRQIAVTAEDCGFDSIWVGDHLLFRDDITGSRGPWEAWSMLAALAEATETVNLGPLVAATSFHAPAMIAKKAATIDEISGGRLILGLGAGWNKAEYEAFGFPYDHRVSRFEEALTIIHTLIRDGFVDFDGVYYNLREMELLPRPRPGIPLMVGSNGPRMLRIAAPFMDMWNTWHVWFDNLPGEIGALIEELEDACREVGREPSEIAKTAALYIQLGRGSGRVAGSEERPTVQPIPVEGSAEALAELEEQGVTHVQIVLDPIDAAGVEELASNVV
jgi:probable F420-dependent oxidoreductase